MSKKVKHLPHLFRSRRAKQTDLHLGQIKANIVTKNNKAILFNHVMLA